MSLLYSNKVTVELSFEDIKKKSVLYSKSSKTYHQRLNATALELCLENPTLSDNKKKSLWNSVVKNLIMTATVTAKKDQDQNCLEQDQWRMLAVARK